MKQPFSEVSRNTINKKLALQNRDFFLSLFTKLLSLWLHFSSYFSASFQDFSSETSNLTWNNFWSNSSSNIQVIIIFAHHMKKKRRKNIVSQSWIIFIWISPLFLQKRRKPTKYLENKPSSSRKNLEIRNFLSFRFFNIKNQPFQLHTEANLQFLPKITNNENIEKKIVFLPQCAFTKIHIKSYSTSILFLSTSTFFSY